MPDASVRNEDKFKAPRPGAAHKGRHPPRRGRSPRPEPSTASRADLRTSMQAPDTHSGDHGRAYQRGPGSSRPPTRRAAQAGGGRAPARRSSGGAESAAARTRGSRRGARPGRGETDALVGAHHLTRRCSDSPSIAASGLRNSTNGDVPARAPTCSRRRNLRSSPAELSRQEDPPEPPGSRRRTRCRRRSRGRRRSPTGARHRT